MVTISLLRVSRRKYLRGERDAGYYIETAIQIRITTGKGFKRDGKEGSCPRQN
jgi:hypothetical protein